MESDDFWNAFLWSAYVTKNSKPWCAISEKIIRGKTLIHIQPVLVSKFINEEETLS